MEMRLTVTAVLFVRKALNGIGVQYERLLGRIIGSRACQNLNS